MIPVDNMIPRVENYFNAHPAAGAYTVDAVERTFLFHLLITEGVSRTCLAEAYSVLAPRLSAARNEKAAAFAYDKACSEAWNQKNLSLLLRHGLKSPKIQRSVCRIVLCAGFSAAVYKIYAHGKKVQAGQQGEIQELRDALSHLAKRVVPLSEAVGSLHKATELLSKPNWGNL